MNIKIHRSLILSYKYIEYEFNSLTATGEEIGPSRDKAVPALSRLTPKRGSILS
jgi:hypothetical protein